MYKTKNNFKSGKRSFGGRGSFQKRRGSQNHGSRGRGPKPSYIDESKLINRAEVETVTEAYVPTHTFNDFAVDERIKQNLSRSGFVTPTPIQDQTIPHALKGRDVVGIANTGTGKTLAFILPLLDKALKNPREKMLIVAPTRELAQQIEAELFKFTKGLNIFSVVGVGGLPIYKQISFLKRGYTFVIGTPGRLMDLRDRKALDFSKFNTVVLDEADRMLDMGFIKDIESMLKEMPANRQTLFFSATMSREIEALIGRFLKDHVTVSVKTRETSKTIDQDVVRINGGASKLETLAEMLIKEEFEKVLIFGKTKRGVEDLSRSLVAKGFKSESVHGDKAQSQRQRSLLAFKRNNVQILVATDVAARGLDIPNVSHVINFDMPATYEDYVHRIGRTGRGGKTGKALTFVEERAPRHSQGDRPKRQFTPQRHAANRYSR
ncbi:MAG: ATP-dependent RNA helicase [Candidatus Zambryskibacteria bacterium CG10_big_fil_rev_8_21_14_0_10_42_12]|uniref:ATP-dependent RNA helicase n=1 Tax=Candidatus Zambryskibacteria bacterium CG10_big_fil_rev_8_21_14_0_10_42_12 TaxID=1975115 RepID=A0A2H0QWW7_9BACT|nr:MAG: ATP-dependent RNA helicase [Candidatus Zambryskibacteria bacterium CG10_big_fil_rev_8_21_14_0_10_42_12]